MNFNDLNTTSAITTVDDIRQMLAHITSTLQQRNETDEEKVIRLVKGDFELRCGISLEIFLKIYNTKFKISSEGLL